MKVHLLAVSLLSSAVVFAAAPDYPVFVASDPNPNDYSIFANAGWDGNWYVGYNNSWTKKLPPIPAGRYSHAFIGAKLGRMKVLPPVGKPPVISPIPGEIWTGIASTPSWTTAQRLKLTITEDIPLDGSPEYPLENVGESAWFWVEVPLAALNFYGDNYIALWSPTPALISVSSSPVVAAAWGGKETNSWLGKDVKGAPPADAKAALNSPISFFQPGIALKLIPEGNPHALQCRVVTWQNGTADHPKPVITASVAGESIERVWLEVNSRIQHGDVVRGGWTNVGRSLWKAPYTFSLDQAKLPTGRVQLRVAASNIWEETAASTPFEIDVQPVKPKK